MFRKNIAIWLMSSIIIFNGFFVIKTPICEAYWGEFPSTLMNQAWATAIAAFKDAMLTSLKKQANNLLRDRLRVSLAGQGNPLVITDYDDFIYGESQREATLYTRDFFETLNNGVGGGTAAKHNEIEDALLSPQGEASTIDQYVQGGTANIFDESQGGGSQAIMAMATNNMNTPFGVYLRAQQILESSEAQARNRAEIEAVAGAGFVSKTDPENNLINLPGSVIAGMTTKTESSYMDMLNQAQSIPEVVGTVAANMLSKTIEAGVVKVTRPIDNQLRTINNNTEDGVRGLQDEIYGGFGTLR